MNQGFWQKGYKGWGELKRAVGEDVLLSKIFNRKNTLIKVNYYTRLLDLNFQGNKDNAIFVIRLPWQWANSCLKHPRFRKEYSYWYLEDSQYNGTGEYEPQMKYLIDLWLEITSSILKNSSKFKNVLYLDYYSYVTNYSILNSKLNKFYGSNIDTLSGNGSINLASNTNSRRSKGELKDDIPHCVKDYRIEEINKNLKLLGFIV